MQRPRGLIGLGVVASALSACATSPQQVGNAPSTHHAFGVAAINGQTTQINHWVALRPDCSTPGYYDVQILSAPAHGQAEIVQGQYAPRISGVDAPPPCGLSKRPGIALMYTPTAGFVGYDRLVIAVTTPRGFHWTTDFDVVVSPPPVARQAS